MLIEAQASPFNRAARSLLLLGASGASLVLGVALLWLGADAGQLMVSNTLPAPGRSLLALGMLIGAVVPVAVVLPSLLRGSEPALLAARRVARLGSPFIPLAFAPALFQPLLARHQTHYLVCLAGFGFVLERCLRLALGEMGWTERFGRGSAAANFQKVAPIVVAVAAVLYALWASYLTILNHHRILTGAYDLGIYDNLMFNALKGEPFRSTVLFGDRGGNSLSTHAEYGMLLFLPFYALYPSAEGMLVIQAVMFGAAAIPLYFFAATQLPRWQAATLAIAYFFFAPLHGGQFYDFHWLPLAMFFHFLLYWSLAREKNVVTLVTVLVLFALREDTAPGMAMLGLFLMLSGTRPKVGALLSVVSLTWFAVNKFMIMPALGSWWFDQLYKDLIAPGEKGGSSIVKTLMVNPVYVLGTLLTEAKFAYALHLLAPLALLPLRRPLFLLLLIPGALFTLLTSDYGAATSIRYQYPTHWIPYLFFTTILGLKLLERVSARHAVAALATLCLTLGFHSAVFGAIIDPKSFLVVGKPLEFSMSAEEKANYAELRQIIAQIPKDASLTTTDFEAPHVSNRKDVYAIGQDLSAGEYFLIHLRSIGLGATKNNVLKLLGEYPYGLVTSVPNRVYLFKKGAQSAGTQAAIQEIRNAR